MGLHKKRRLDVPLVPQPQPAQLPGVVSDPVQQRVDGRVLPDAVVVRGKGLRQEDLVHAGHFQEPLRRAVKVPDDPERFQGGEIRSLHRHPPQRGLNYPQQVPHCALLQVPTGLEHPQNGSVPLDGDWVAVLHQNPGVELGGVRALEPLVVGRGSASARISLSLRVRGGTHLVL